MIKILKHFTATLLLCVFLPTSPSWADASAHQQLMDVSGFSEQIKHFPAIMKLSFSDAGGQALSPQTQQTFINAVDKAFNTNHFEQTVRSQLEKDLSREDIDLILAWYETDVAKKITAAESAASTPESMVDMQMNAAKLMGNTERMAFARRIDALVGMTESAMSMQEYIGIAMLSAMASTQVNNASMDMDTMKQMLDAQMGQQRQMLSDQIAIQLVYTYQNLNDATLSGYEHTLAKPAFKAFYQSGLSAMNRGMEIFITDWADIIAQETP